MYLIYLTSMRALRRFDAANIVRHASGGGGARQAAAYAPARPQPLRPDKDTPQPTTGAGAGAGAATGAAAGTATSPTSSSTRCLGTASPDGTSQDTSYRLQASAEHGSACSHRDESTRMSLSTTVSDTTGGGADRGDGSGGASLELLPRTNCTDSRALDSEASSTRLRLLGSGSGSASGGSSRARVVPTLMCQTSGGPTTPLRAETTSCAALDPTASNPSPALSSTCSKRPVLSCCGVPERTLTRSCTSSVNFRWRPTTPTRATRCGTVRTSHCSTSVGSPRRRRPQPGFATARVPMMAVAGVGPCRAGGAARMTRLRPRGAASRNSWTALVASRARRRDACRRPRSSRT